MASYPNSIPSFPTPGATLASPAHSTLHSSADGEIVAICTELGTLPKGIYVSVADRLAGIEASIVGTGHVQNTDLGTTSSTFYLGGTGGPKLKQSAGAFELRNDLDSAYVNLTLQDLILNGVLSDGFATATVSAIAATILDSHTHANKGLLDTYDQLNTSIVSAISRSHSQNTDTGTDNETFQLNNGTPTSARLKVDDLDPTLVEIRNGADSQYADIRALGFRGPLIQDIGGTFRPSIRFNPSGHWEFSNDGTVWQSFGASGISLGGPAGSVQYNDTTTLGGEAAFSYDPITNTLSIDNINLSGNLTNGVQTVTVLDLSNAVSLAHSAATAGTGISVGGGSGQVITNSAPDQVVSIGNSTHVTVGGAYPAFTLTDTALGDGLTSAHIFVGNGSGVATDVALTGPVSIDNTGLTAVTLALNDLSDVAISSPSVDHILRYNGVTWVNGPETNVNSGSGVDYFYDTTASDIGGGYETLNKAPQSIVEQDQTRVVNNNKLLITAFASPNTGIGGTQIDAGVWTFDIWAYASLVAQPTYIEIEVYSRTEPGGVETLLFTVDSPNVTTTQDLYSVLSIQQAYAISSSDRLVIKVYAVTQNLVNTTVHFAFGGTTHYSHVNTPLIVRHNDIAGLQGGGATERYHMTQAQNTALHVAATAGTGIGVAGQVISLSHLGLESLTDPGADTLMGWDDTDNATKFIIIGTNLTYDHATHTLNASGGSTLTRATFTNATLVAGILTITHNKGLSAPYTIMVTIFNNNNKQIIPDEITGATNSVDIDLTSYVDAGGGSIIGTWGYGYIA